VGDENVYEMRIANDNWDVSLVVINVKSCCLELVMKCLALSVSQYTIAAGNTRVSREILCYRREYLNGRPHYFPASVSDTTTKRREIQPRSFVYLNGRALSFIAELSGITLSPAEIQTPSSTHLNGQYSFFHR
jgi:hypothetical protein